MNTSENPDSASPDGPLALVVDDDPQFAETLRQNLCAAGISARTFPSGPDALAYLESGGSGDIVMLDWKMPEMSGVEVLRKIRDAGHSLPVIFLTVLSDEIYEEAALLNGAVDFVEKSRRFSIVLKRIKLSLEHAAQQAGGKQEPGETMAVGPLAADLNTFRATWRGDPVPLTLTEFKIVRHLAGNPGRDVSYREIYDTVRGEGFIAGDGGQGYRANVRTFIRRIRKKFRDLDDQFEHIENYPGFGYRWRDDGPN